MPTSKTKQIAKSKGRSRLSNGHVLPRNVDSRSQWARRFRDLLIQHATDLGGPDLMSAAEGAIIRRAVTLITELERMEAKFALRGRAEPAELESYQRCANSMRRLLESVGLSRRSRDVTPSLQEYLAERYPAEEAPSVESSREDSE
jgi:hypothetical protein